MDTLIISDEKSLPLAAGILRGGGLTAVPTETVYGLCANGLDAGAVSALYEVKGRPEIKPLSLMIPGPEDMDKYARDIPDAARTLAERFWPGPLTIILPAVESIPSVTLAGGKTVGLRCPDHPLTLALLRLTGFPLAGPSANPSGQPSPKTAAQVLSYFDGKIGAVVDGGPCGIGKESTILDMTAEEALDDALVENMTVYGLSGGSGSGKTTVLEYLTQRGALGLDCDAIYHELLEKDEDMLGWQIYPEINGTLSLQNDDLKAGLHLGTEAFSYFVIHDDKVSGADNVLFSVPVFLTTLRDING